MKCLVELRPNRKFLQPNFDGYKLSLDPIPTWKQTLEANVDRVYPSDDQYSLIHAKQFGLHNHIVNDLWTNSGVYFVDIDWKVTKVSFADHKFQQFEHVYEVPSHVERQSGHYHLSLQFCSEQYAIIADGAGSLHIIKTGNRNRTDAKWNCVFSDQILGAGVCFVIIDSRVEYEEGKEVIHCLLQHIQQRENSFDTVVEWVSLKRENQIWNVISVKQLKVQGYLHYAALEPNCKSLYIASDHPYTFTSDLSSDDSKETEPVKCEKQLTYTWLQTSEDITLTLHLGETYDKGLLNIEIQAKSVNISYDSVELLNGELYAAIDHNFTTWNIQKDGKLDILLTKSESASWAKLLKGGDVKGEEVLDPGLVEEVHQRLAHLCSESEATAEAAPPAFSNQQLEECDAVSEENTSLVRIDSISHKVTHHVPLSVHQVILTVALTPNEPHALGLRHDVDTCIWQPRKLSDIDNIWPVQHQGTLLAFGYVQSSKQQKKFTACPPNMEYSVVCESSRHIFIYRSKSRQDCQLRQRNIAGENKQVNVGQQQVVSLDRDGEILGLCATDEILYVLTEKVMIALQMFS